VTDLAEQVGSHIWYHCIELPSGVVTPGLFDTRGAAKKVPLPASLDGKRCLDVGTADGFWAFEMERRGAREVVAIDLIDPMKRDAAGGRSAPVRAGDEAGRLTNFELARDALGSKVEWRNLSVYDLASADVGEFDFVFMGSLLLHLRDPVGALAAIRSVTRGEFLSYDTVSPWLTVLHPRMPVARLKGTEIDWWTPNVAGLRRMIEAGGFEIVRAGGLSFQGWRGKEFRLRPLLKHPVTMLMLRFVGVPQSWVFARPASR